MTDRHGLRRRGRRDGRAGMVVQVQAVRFHDGMTDKLDWFMFNDQIQFPDRLPFPGLLGTLCAREGDGVGGDGHGE